MRFHQILRIRPLNQGSDHCTKHKTFLTGGGSYKYIKKRVVQYWKLQNIHMIIAFHAFTVCKMTEYNLLQGESFSFNRPQFIRNRALYFCRCWKCHFFWRVFCCTPVKNNSCVPSLNSAQTGSKWSSTACAPDPAICFHIDIKPSIRGMLSSSWQRLGCWLWHPVNN